MLKQIPGFSRYLIDKNGVVTNKLTEKVVTLELPWNRVKLIADDGVRKQFKPFEILADLFKEPEPVKNPYIDEVAGKAKQSNIDFRKLPAEEKRGLHVSNKITHEQVNEIRKNYDQKTMKKKQIAEKYGICWQTAGKICNRKIYKKVKEYAGSPYAAEVG